MGLLSSFTILLTMAIFSHARPGVATVARRVIVKDGFTQAGNVDFEIEQPANSVIDNVYWRQLKAPTFATNTSVKFTLGYAAHGDTTIVDTGPDGILDDGTTIAEGYVLDMKGNPGTDISYTFQYSTDDDPAPGVAPGFSSNGRDLHARVTCTDDVITVNGDYEVTVVFKVFE